MKNLKKYLLFVLTLSVIATNTLACSKISTASLPKEDFDTFTNRVFTAEVQKDTLSLNYSLANPENYGITNPEITFGHYSVENVKEDLMNSENYLAALKKYKYKSLTEEQKLTYDILKEDLELEQKMGDFILYTEGLGPTTGIQAQLPVLLAEYNFYDKGDIETYLKLLPDIYEYFKEICAFEEKKSAAGLFMSDAVADNILDQCKKFIEDTKDNYLIDIFNDRIDAYDGLTDSERKAYKAANKDAVLNQVIPAYQLLIDTLTKLKGTGKNNGGLSHFPKGKEYYEYLIKNNTGSSRSIPELKKMLTNSLTANLVKMSTIRSDNPDVYDKALDVTYPYKDPEEIVNYFKNAIKADFPACPDVNYSIKYIHKSLQKHLSPAMYLIPAIDNYEDNNIYINTNPDYDQSGLFTTLAHEGYPGHLFQSVYFRSKNPAPIRSLLSFGGYAEGWATYVEYYAYHMADLDEAVADFLEASMAANMALYCLLDIGINYDGWSLSDTANFLKSYMDNTKAVKILYTTMIEEPALYPQYGVGYLEFLNLKESAQKALGNKFNIKEFHKFLLDVGPAQFDVISGRLKTWVKNQ